MVAKEAFKEPWRYSAAGISIALRVTPRGGRDDIDGIEQLADGRSVKGFLVEPEVLAEARDITSYGGWRAYMAELKKA